MATEVSSLIRLMNGGDSNEKSTAPMITRDLLGGGYNFDDSKELDLDLQVPSGWEKRLDLKSGKVFIQRCNSTNSSSSTFEIKASNIKTRANFQDLNNFTPSPNQMLNLFDDSSLDLKIVSSASASPSSSNYQSVCTLEKVKSALDRVEKEMARKRSLSSMSKSSSPRSNSSSFIKDSEFDQEVRSQASSYAAGCPCCLMYVLVLTSNPKCPRCNSTVPVPVPVPMFAKKPKIDLNMSI